MSGMTRKHYDAISHSLFDWYIHSGGDMGIPVERYKDLVDRLGHTLSAYHQGTDKYAFNMTRWREACLGADHMKKALREIA